MQRMQLREQGLSSHKYHALHNLKDTHGELGQYGSVASIASFDAKAGITEVSRSGLSRLTPPTGHHIGEPEALASSLAIMRTLAGSRLRWPMENVHGRPTRRK